MPPPDARKSTAGGSKIYLRRLQNEAKMAPKWLPGGPPEPRPAFEAFMVRSGAARGGSWGLLGSLLAPLGFVVGLPRCPRRLPEGPREAPGEPLGGHFGGIFAARPAGTEKVRKISIFLDMSDAMFMLFFVVVLRLPRCAGASAHLEKYWFSPGGYCKNRLSPIFARSEKTT